MESIAICNGSQGCAERARSAWIARSDMIKCVRLYNSQGKSFVSAVSPVRRGAFAEIARFGFGGRNARGQVTCYHAWACVFLLKTR